MKKILFISIFCLTATTKTNAQMRDTTVNINTHKVDANSLFQKSKKQKTAAWIMLGGGTAIALAGLAIMSGDAGSNASQDLSAAFTTIFSFGFATPAPVVHKHSAAGPILAIAGSGAILGSIPLFTASGKNKRKAILILKNENVLLNPQLNTREHLVSLGMKINL